MKKLMAGAAVALIAAQVSFAADPIKADGDTVVVTDDREASSVGFTANGGTIIIDGATVDSAGALSSAENSKKGVRTELKNGARLAIGARTFYGTSQNNPTELVVTGGSTFEMKTGTTNFNMGNNTSGSRGELAVTNATFVSPVEMFLYGCCDVSLVNATFTTGNKTTFGNSRLAGTTAKFICVNSTVDVAPNSSFLLGIGQDYESTVSGGTFAANTLALGGWATKDATSSAESRITFDQGAVATISKLQIGAELGAYGEVTVDGGAEVTVLADTQVGTYGTGKLVLNGGVLKTKTISTSDGSGTVEGNGGTLQLTSACKVFDKVGSVTVGAKGLVIHTGGNAVTLSQSITGAGLVLFTGGGSVTFAEGVTVENFDAAGGTKLLWPGEGTTTTVTKTEPGVETRKDAVTFAGNDTYVFDVASGAGLVYEGKVGIGAIEKRGGGLLGLDNAADRFFGGITLTGGTLGFGENAPASFGSFEIGNQTAQALTVVKADRDVTMAFPTKDFKGAFLKRGAGNLVLERNVGWLIYSSPSAPVTAVKDLDHENPISFGDGTVLPTANYLPVNVTEGRLTLRGTHADGTRDNFRFQHTVAVGLPVSEALAAQPELSIENLTVDPTQINVGSHVVEGSPVTAPKLIVTNTSLTANISVGEWSTSSTLRPSVEIRDSTVSSGQAWFNGGYQNGNANHTSSWQIVDSKLYCSLYAVVARPAHVEFDGSTFAKSSSLESFTFCYYSAAATTFVFANGSKFYFTSTFNIDGGAARQTWVFDDSTWHWGAASGDRTYALAHNGSPVKFVWLEMRGKGLVLEPADGETFTMAEVLHGEGGFVNRGAGTTVLRDGVIDYAGVTCAEQGTIDFDGASVTNVTLAGSGTFVNGTLTDAKVLADGTAPQLGGVTLDGKVTVVFGETAPEIGTTVDVARYSGDIANWKAKRSKDYSVTLTTDGTTVKATIEPPKGLMLIFR